MKTFGIKVLFDGVRVWVPEDGKSENPMEFEDEKSAHDYANSFLGEDSDWKVSQIQDEKYVIDQILLAISNGLPYRTMQEDDMLIISVENPDYVSGEKENMLLTATFKINEVAK